MPTIVTVGTASAKGFGWSSGGPKINYYIISFDRFSNNNGTQGTLAYSPATGEVYTGLNYDTSASPAAAFGFARIKISDFSVTYTQHLNEVATGILSAPYFSQPLYNPAAGITFHMYTGGLNLYGNFSTGGVPSYSWIKRYVLSIASYPTLDSAAQTIDGSGNHYIGGTYHGTVTLCCCVTADTYATYIMKTSSFGVQQWQFYASFNYYSYYILQGIKAASSGNVYAIYESDLGPGKFVKFDTNGTVQWANTITNSVSAFGGSGGVEKNHNIAIDSSENIYLSVTFGTVYSLIKYNSSGTLQWARRYIPVSPSTQMGSGFAIGVSSSGDIYLWGSGYPAATTGSLYLLKYNSSGTIQWQRKWTTNNSTSGDQLMQNYGGVIVATDGSVLLGAYGIGAGTNVGFPTVFKLPADGTGTGSYTLQSAVYTYASVSGTDSNYTSSITTTASSHGSTSTTSTATLGTSSFTSTTVSKDTVSVV